MKKHYLYKNINVYMTGGRYQAEYVQEDGKRFALHYGCRKTKKEAYKEAQEQIDHLNTLATA